ncbi:hypothetical protein SK128_011319, partial [Halocaridina rubra]
VEGLQSLHLTELSQDLLGPCKSWACIVGMALFIGITLEIMVRIESVVSPFQSQFPVPIHPLVSALKIFVYQGSKQWPIGPGSRVAACFGFFTALIMGSLYSGSITAFFAIPFRSKPIDSALDLINSDVRPALRSKTNFYQSLLAENGILFPARDRAAAFSGKDIASWNFLKLVADGKYALADVYSSAVGVAFSFEKRGERCKFYLAKESVRTDTDVFAFQKNSPILYQFNHKMKWLRYYGIIQHLKEKYYAVQCEMEIKSEGPHPMTIYQVQGAGYILAIGLVIAITGFFFEVTWSRLRTRNIKVAKVAIPLVMGVASQTTHVHLKLTYLDHHERIKEN